MLAQKITALFLLFHCSLYAVLPDSTHSLPKLVQYKKQVICSKTVCDLYLKIETPVECSGQLQLYSLNAGLKFQSERQEIHNAVSLPIHLNKDIPQQLVFRMHMLKTNHFYPITASFLVNPDLQKWMEVMEQKEAKNTFLQNIARLKLPIVEKTAFFIRPSFLNPLQKQR
jgi:hypothetical protein